MEKIDRKQTIDETKAKLKASREELEGELEFQLQDIQQDAIDFAKQVLLLGGGLYLSWKLVKALTGSKKKKAKKQKRRRRYEADNENKNGGIGKVLMHQIISLATMAASEQIKQAIKQRRTGDDSKKNP